MAAAAPGVDAGCVIRRLSRRMSYTCDDEGVTARSPLKLLDQVRGRLRLAGWASAVTSEAGWFSGFG